MRIGMYGTGAETCAILVCPVIYDATQVSVTKGVALRAPNEGLRTASTGMTHCITDAGGIADGVTHPSVHATCVACRQRHLAALLGSNRWRLSSITRRRFEAFSR
jgi:hypothetical protein